MESNELIATENPVQHLDRRDPRLNGLEVNGESHTTVTRSRRPLWFTGQSLTRSFCPETQLSLAGSDVEYSDQEDQFDVSAMSLADFVQRKFIPEYVQIRRSAGRAHFHAILKHVLCPEDIALAYGGGSEKADVKRKTIQGWPFMGSLRIRDIDENRIQQLTSTALGHGYSIQTVTHIRNVLRAIFSHAIRACGYGGLNPATQVTLPAMTRKKAHTLTLAQLKQVLPVMHYPEKGIALFALLTEMSVAEICGLQWQYVNMTSSGIAADQDWFPPKTIAVRNQWYRGEFGPAIGSRNRFVPVPDLLCSILRDLKSRKQFTRPQDFVIASRSGTPVYPENIAARRLKSIGKAFEMPWLSWHVFHRTHISLRTEFGRHLHKEYEKVLPLHMW
jgi:integrase